MKQRFILFRRAGVFYAEETATGKQTSLRTKDEAEAITLLNTKNEATRQPAMNLQIAQVYLQHADATMAQRTWQGVMDAMAPLKTGPTQTRWIAAMRDKSFDLTVGIPFPMLASSASKLSISSLIEIAFRNWLAVRFCSVVI
jgi:hypothetical protein